MSKGWELICLLDANEYRGVETFSKKFCKRLEDGTILYKAKWKEWREDDPRSFVLAQEPERLIVYWGTPKIVEKLTAEEFISVYRDRTEIQENGIKRMIAHAGLNVNHGNKVIYVPDRTHQRKVEKIEKKIGKVEHRQEKAQQKIAEQTQKVTESIEKQHSKLLELRNNKLQQLYQCHDEIKVKKDRLLKEKEDIGEPGLRADRDFQKQTIMTFRSCLLENLLSIFVSLISKALSRPVDVEVILKLFFRRAGIVQENSSEILYTLNSDNLSSEYRIILQELIDGFNRLSLRSSQ